MTIRECFEAMQEPYKSQALSLIEEKGYAFCAGTEDYQKISDAVIDAIDWEQSPEGWDYWDSHYHSLKNLGL